MGTSSRLAVCIPIVAVLVWASSSVIGDAQANLLLSKDKLEQGDLRAAISHSPRAPFAHELLGLSLSRHSDDPVADRGEAVAQVKRSLELRPVSPYAWASLAEVQYLQGAPVQGLEIAFDRAARLGPSEAQVQRKLADYGLAVRDEISAESRKTIDRVMGAGFRRNPLELLRISQRRGRLDVACRHLAQVPNSPNSEWSKLCQSPEATP